MVLHSIWIPYKSCEMYIYVKYIKVMKHYGRPLLTLAMDITVAVYCDKCAIYVDVPVLK